MMMKLGALSIQTQAQVTIRGHNFIQQLHNCIQQLYTPRLDWPTSAPPRSRSVISLPYTSAA